jgi:hypothetical protein
MSKPSYCVLLALAFFGVKKEHQTRVLCVLVFLTAMEKHPEIYISGLKWYSPFSLQG